MPESAKRNVPYTRLAEFYDTLAAYAPPMNRHARHAMLKSVAPRITSACDLACGSGETALDLARDGLRVFAVDWAPRFCRTVRAKARAAKLDVTVVASDMRTFRLPEPVDLVVCEFAALNNLDQHAGLGRTFAAVKRALKPGGYFLFDVNSTLSFRTQVTPVQWVDTPSFKLVIHGQFRDGGRRATLELEWFVPRGKAFVHEREVLHHVAWTDAEIRAALRMAGLELVRAADGVDVRPPMDGMTRGTDLYYLARRPGGDAPSRRRSRRVRQD